MNSAGQSKYDIITHEALVQMLHNLAKQVQSSTKPFDAILGISRGGLVPAVELSHMLEINNFNVIKISRAASNAANAELLTPVVQKVDLSYLADKNVLIVDDLVDEGLSIIALKEYLHGQGVHTFSVLTLVRKSHSLVIPDYCAQVMDKWVVFPWEVMPEDA
jgi:uncharacterized protein